MQTIREILLLCRDEIVGLGLTVAIRSIIIVAPLVGRARACAAATRLIQSYARMTRIDGGS